ncbi:hypothetical protein QR90_13420 [Deinococcus radiopugnans]|uniref:Uncharacterized protein n=2 Tax=Deinococcus radiopugnans TaxID=57497 RepID=A0A0A7KKY2_9DEIO|nr:hypothetical protein [Deinococcus radiopugnans]AIZ45859.1 hypothetical protein QR90_13420 [Deinococcus radiopugnans]MBB6015865.1 hypothetical protein [Deinococcus radiopugnans ATCC 19172]QLG11646.1 hypothetical protein HLB42_13280 [Deinococcus sp. D7000]TNM72431.1 hypothetical protein FHR04_03840 [Deinococcus radiopugnans ATCC 19172]
MISSFDSDRRWNLQKRTLLGSPELQDFRPALPLAQPEPVALQVCPESLTRALMAEEHRQTLKLVGRLRWASQAAKN